MSTRIQVDTKTFVRFWLVILGFILAALFIYQASTGLIIIGASVFFAIAISPLVQKLARLIPGKGRTAPTALAYILVVGVIITIISVITPVVIHESVRFVSNLPQTIDDATNNLGALNDIGKRIGIDNLSEQINLAIEGFSKSFVEDLGNNLLSSVSAISSFVAATILVLILTFLMLMDGPKLVKNFWQNFESNPRAKHIEKILDRMAQVVAVYVTGALTVSLINGCATTIVVLILSTIFGFISSGLAIPFGLITGILSLIPMFGSFIGGSIVAILLAFNSPVAGIIFFIYIIVYLQIEANFISPKVQSRRLKLPALLVLSAVTIGIYMFGLIGAIISIPIAGCIKVLVEEVGYFNRQKNNKSLPSDTAKKQDDTKLSSNHKAAASSPIKD